MTTAKLGGGGQRGAGEDPDEPTTIKRSASLSQARDLKPVFCNDMEGKAASMRGFRRPKQISKQSPVNEAPVTD